MKTSFLQQFMLIAIIGTASCSTEPGEPDTAPKTFENQAPGTYVFEDPNTDVKITYFIDKDNELELSETTDGINFVTYYLDSKVPGDETRAYYRSNEDYTYIGVEVITGGIVNGEAGKTLSLFKDTTLPLDIKGWDDILEVKWDEINRINSTIPPNLDPNSFVVKAPGTYKFEDPNTDVKITYVVKGDLDIYDANDVKLYEFMKQVEANEDQAFYRNPQTHAYIGVEVVREGSLINSDPATDGKMLSLFRDTTSPINIIDFADESSVKWEEANKINSTVPIFVDPNLFIGKAPGTYIFEDPDNLEGNITYTIGNDLHLYLDTTKVYDYIEQNEASQEQAFYKSATGDTYIGVEVVREGTIDNSDPKTDKMLSLFKDTSFVIDIKDFATQTDVTWGEDNRINSTVPKTPKDPNSFEAMVPGNYTFTVQNAGDGSVETIYTVDRATLDIYIADDKKYDFVAKVVGDETRAHYQNSDTDKYIGVEVVTGGIVNGDAGKTLTLFKDKSHPLVVREWINPADIVWSDQNRIVYAEIPAQPWIDVAGTTSSVGISTQAVHWISSIVDKDDNLYVFAQDSGGRLQRYDANAQTWKQIIVTTEGTDTSDIETDTDGNIYIVATTTATKVWKATATDLANAANGADNVFTDLALPAGLNGKSTITIDPTTKHIYVAVSGAGVVTVKKYDGANWTDAGTVTDASVGVSHFTALATDDTGKVYLAVGGGNLAAHNLKVYKLETSGVTWTSTTGETAIGSAMDIDLEFNDTGSFKGLYLAYKDSNKDGKATVKKLNGAGDAWETQGVEGFTGANSDYLSIAFDGNGNTILAYGGDSQSGLAGPSKAYYLLDNQWEALGTGQASSGDSYYSSLAVSSSGTVYLSFHDREAGGKLTVKQY